MKLSKIAQMTDRAGLRNLMDNAKRLGRDDVYWAAFKRFCALEGIVHDDPLTRDVSSDGTSIPAGANFLKRIEDGLIECITERGVRTHGVVMASPALDHDLGLLNSPLTKSGLDEVGIV